MAECTLTLRIPQKLSTSFGQICSSMVVTGIAETLQYTSTSQQQRHNFYAKRQINKVQLVVPYKAKFSLFLRNDVFLTTCLCALAFHYNHDVERDS